MRRSLWSDRPLGVKLAALVAAGAAALGAFAVVTVGALQDTGERTDEVLASFGQALAQIPEVLEAFLISGDYDYFIRIAVRDTRDYERLLRERLYRIPGIRHSKSSFVLRKLKETASPWDLPAAPPAAPPNRRRRTKG